VLGFDGEARARDGLRCQVEGSEFVGRERHEVPQGAGRKPPAPAAVRVIGNVSVREPRLQYAQHALCGALGDAEALHHVVDGHADMTPCGHGRELNKLACL
jgi:hypothetical protein